jgi:hypothetical protein
MILFENKTEKFLLYMAILEDANIVLHYILKDKTAK